MEFLKAAILYGIVHDQVTAHILRGIFFRRASDDPASYLSNAFGFSVGNLSNLVGWRHLGISGLQSPPGGVAESH